MCLAVCEHALSRGVAGDFKGVCTGTKVRASKALQTRGGLALYSPFQFFRSGKCNFLRFSQDILGK